MLRAQGTSGDVLSRATYTIMNTAAATLCFFHQAIIRARLTHFLMQG